MTPRAIRLTVVLTHPVQYYSPWFREIATRWPQLDLTVVYVTAPTPLQQGVGFGTAMTWDVPLLDGYRHVIVRPPQPEDDFDAAARPGVDARELDAALAQGRPDVVLVPGWHAAGLRRAIRWARTSGVPLLYRGDSTLESGPRGPWRGAWRLKTRLELSRFDACLVTGTRAGAYLRSMGRPGRQLFDAPHAVDNALFAAGAAGLASDPARAAAREALGLPPRAFVALFVGKLLPVKRPLDAVAAVARLGAGACLAVVGSGPLEAACRREAERLGVDVAWLGFRNQTELGRVYGVADALVLPSQSESWGLVVNEALASGLPAVVSDGVGAAPDLVVPGETGDVFPVGDVAACVAALERVRKGRAEGSITPERCRRQAERHGFAQASAGLLRACRAVACREAPRPAAVPRGARVLVGCEGMSIVSGVERLTFEVVRHLVEGGASVHCLVNTWENDRIVPLAESAGATWSVGASWEGLGSARGSVATAVRMGADVLRASLRLYREALRWSATHVLLAESTSGLRYAPALALLRLRGVRVVERVGNAPEPTPRQTAQWRMLRRVVDTFVPNSRFGAARLAEVGVPDGRVRLIRNAVARRAAAARDPALLVWMRERPTLVCLGQIAPFKGTHHFVETVLALRRAGREVRGLVVGRVPEWPPQFVEYAAELRRQAEADGGVRFVGERDDVPALLESAFLLVAPILQQETFGNVVLEAASAGLPAVVYGNGGLPELVEHGVTGWICRDSDPGALRAGITHFLDDPAARVRAGAIARRRALDRGGDHDPAVFARRWRRVFE